jgi:hypothetical protein
MEFLVSLFVGRPLNILAVGGAFLAGYFALRSSALGGGGRFRLLFVTAVAWVVYGVWEWLVLVRTPEADIRIDLLVIWPALATLSALALFCSVWQAGSIVRRTPGVARKR